ncbi:MAG TPA: hypothetical protein VMN39_03470 [Longimicrobiaceae bacterium]|nr:hypothetical protein [Longimicrobiaceae bacterium]
MAQPQDSNFALEASEQLDQLEHLLGLQSAPDAEQLLRLAGSVLTSARRAGAETVAAVAERLEDAARSILTGNIAWSEEIRALSARTVADMQLLLRALNRWGPEEEGRVRSALERWDEHDGGAEVTCAPQSEPLPIASLYYDDAGPHVVEEGGVPADEPVPVERLLLRGDAALRAAMSLRPELESIARGDAVPERSLADLVQELFDLLELAAEEEAAVSPVRVE